LYQKREKIKRFECFNKKVTYISNITYQKISAPCVFACAFSCWSHETMFFNTTGCCDRKSRAACAQSFAPWQQATVEIMRRNLSYYCLLALHILWCCPSRTSHSWWITQST